MKKLLIIGAGGFGREVAAWIQTDPGVSDYQLAGFLDDDRDALNGKQALAPIVGAVADHQPQADTVYLCGLGNPAARVQVAEDFGARGAVFGSFVARAAYVAPSAKIGTGVIICPFASVTTDTVIGDHSVVMGFSGVGHDVRIGKGSMISAGVLLGGFCEIGDAVFIGSNTCVVPGIKVQDRARLGAGSVVVRNVAAGASVFGVPAKTIS